MATHYIPKDLKKSETRLLKIFSIKALIFTAIFAGVGLIPFIIFKQMRMDIVGIVIMVVFALIGFVFGTVKIPKINGVKFTKNVEGDAIDEIFKRYIKFNSNKKIYSYTKEEK